ncbi:MAG: [citrate (pro-3S)-lyase] ligase [Oscillospiraceae bacterium]
MYGYIEKRISKWDNNANKMLNELLINEGISLDGNLEYTMGLYDGEKLVATGSYFKNSLRCLAVDSNYRGEGLLNLVVTHLVNKQAEIGNYHLFLYTKCDKTPFFTDLGFNEIATAPKLAAFMENRKNGFSDYINHLKIESKGANGTQAAIVMNCNPFTLGHQYLIENAASENDYLHIFVVSEDISLVPFHVRFNLIKQGTSHLKNVILHQTESYMISSATFPSYFIKDSDDVMLAQAMIDIEIFKKIASSLNISKRYVGEEPLSKVTEIYNEVMINELKKSGINCIVIPRLEGNGSAISASTVRSLIKQGNIESIKPLVPKSTYDFFMSDSANEIIQKIQSSDNVIHH